MDIEKLNIKSGDIILVKNYESRDAVYKLADGIKSLGIQDVMIIYGMDVKVLSEEEMERHGWKKENSGRGKTKENSGSNKGRKTKNRSRSI